MNMPVSFLWTCMVSLLLTGVQGTEVIVTPSAPTTYTTAAPLLVKVSDLGFTGTLTQWWISLWIKPTSDPIPAILVKFTLNASTVQTITSAMFTARNEPTGWIFISCRSPASSMVAKVDTYVSGWTSPRGGFITNIPSASLTTSVAQIQAPSGGVQGDSVSIT